MLGQHGRGLTKALLTRPALAMARVGITPNMLTVVGTVLSVGVAVATLPQGRFIMGPPLLGVVLIGDSFDGILARATGRSSVFGAFLDSTLDRLADGAIFASLAAWAALSMKTDSAFLHVATVCLALACVVLAAVVPYAAPAPNPSVRPPRSGSPSAPTVWWSPWWRPSWSGSERPSGCSPRLSAM